jgi:hypothetical protein
MSAAHVVHMWERRAVPWAVAMERRRCALETLALVALEPIAHFTKALAGFARMPKGNMTKGSTLVIKPLSTAGLYFASFLYVAHAKDLICPRWQDAATTTSTAITVAGSQRSAQSSAQGATVRV